MSNAIATTVAQTKKANAKKPAAKKTTAKAASTKTASNQPRTAAPSKKVFQYRIVTGRPASGTALYAYTQAWLEIAGLDKGKSVDRRDAEAAAGYTAIAYHVRTGRMQESEGRVSITAGGKLHFKSRADRINRDDVEGWKAILRTGKADGRLIKNQACIATA